MEKPNLQKATDELLVARNNLQLAREALLWQEKNYAEKEEAFLKAAGAVEPVSQDGDPVREPSWPATVLCGGVVIIPKEDWFDLKAGARLDYQTVTPVEIVKAANG